MRERFLVWFERQGQALLDRYFPFETRRRAVANQVSHIAAGLTMGDLFIHRGHVYCLHCGSKVNLLRALGRRWDPCPSCDRLAAQMYHAALHEVRYGAN